MNRTVLLILFLWLGYSTSSYACSCLVYTNIDTAFHRAKVVFIGRVERIISDDIYQKQDQPSNSVFVNFNVLKSYKNAIGTSRPLTFINQQTSCDYDFVQGKEYIVFGYMGACGFHYADVCTRTALVSELTSEELGRLEYLADNTSEERILESALFIDPARMDYMNLTIEQLKANNQDLERNNSLLRYLLLSSGLILAVLTFLYFKRK